MKRRSLLLSFALVGLAAGLSVVHSAETPHHSLSLDVVVTGTGGATDVKTATPTPRPATSSSSSNYKPRSFEYTRDKESALGLEAQIRNLAQHADSGTLEWYFFSRPLEGGGDEEMFDSGAQAVTLTPSSNLKVPIKSDSVKSSTTRRATTTTRRTSSNYPTATPKAAQERSGSRITGWVVRLIVDGKPLLVKASSPSLLAKGAKDLGPAPAVEPAPATATPAPATPAARAVATPPAAMPAAATPAMR